MNFDRISSSLNSSNIAKLNSELRKKALEKQVAETSDNSEDSFVDTLKDSAEKVNEFQKEADKQIKELAMGDSKSIVKTMIAIEKADVSFKMATQVRNKLVDAYKELMRMPG